MSTITKISRNLRIAGVFSIAFAIVQFLISGKYNLNSYVTYNLFLGINIVICLLGIFSYTKYKDHKTARTFLGISLAIIPAQFAQLGAFVHSSFSNFSNEINHLPDLILMKLPHDVSLLKTGLISLVVLIPTIILSFSVFNKRHSKILSLNYLISSLVIVLPMRTSLSSFIILLAYYLINLRTLTLLKESISFETQISKAMLFIPMAIVLGRSLFYNVDLLYAGTLLLSLGFALFTHLARTQIAKNQRSVVLIETLSLIPIMIGSCFIAHELNMSAIISLYSFSTLLLLLSFLSVSQGANYIRGAAAAVILSQAFMLSHQFSFGKYALMLILPMLLLSLSYKRKDLVSFNLCISSVVIHILIITKHMVAFPQIATWQSLITLGILAILGAGFIERHFGAVKHKIMNLYARFN